MFTYKERFFATQKGNINYAPMTVGAPQNVVIVDHSVFKKELNEKVELAVIKAQHKKEILKMYGPGSKRLNP